MLSSSSSVFDTLPTRPPTPPSKAIDDAIKSLDGTNEIDRALERRPNDTAQNLETTSPTSTPPADDPPASSNGGRKVGFTPQPTYHQIARLGQLSPPSAQLRKHKPATKDARPARSILKQSSQPPPLTPDDVDHKLLNYFSPQEPGSFGKMLQSVIQQLAGQSVSARLDAYMALNGALAAYDGVPDVLAMTSKMGLLVQFITRDMAWKSSNGVLDANIVTQSLKLLAAIVNDGKLSAALDNDFRTFLVDRSIAVLEQAEMSKQIIKTHMFLLAQTRCYPSVLTQGRTDKMITTLSSIEERCSGNGAIATRLVIYHRLLHVAPVVMLNRMRDWLEHVFHGMLSSIKDVRIRAVETCTQAGLMLGVQPSGTKRLLELFQTEVEEATSYCDYLSHRLMQMISERDIGAYVPQIWSAVILFFRNKRYAVEKWTSFKSWLLIIQKCLNSSDMTIRYEAHLAWNKLVFVVMPDVSTSKAMFGMLKVPITTGMDKQGHDKQSKEIRHFALDGYYNLLHYAFRPGLSHDELDNAWDVFVDPVLSRSIRASAKGGYFACNVLNGICTSCRGAWNVNAANEQPAIKPEELPKIDPRWVRSRLSKVFKLMEPMLQSSLWLAGNSNVHVDAAWTSLMQLLAEAGSQEVKTSNELKEAIALLADLFRRLWANCTPPTSSVDPGSYVDRYTTIVISTVRCIGAGPFAEETLMRSEDDCIEAALTPSHRPSKHHTMPLSTFALLLGLMCNSNANASAEDVINLTAKLLDHLVKARSSTAAQIDLLQRTLQLNPTPGSSEQPLSLADRVWACVAQCTAALLRQPAVFESSQESQSLGLELRSASSILASGLTHVSTCEQSMGAALELYEAMLSAAKSGAGSAGSVLAVSEPAAKSILGKRNILWDEAMFVFTNTIVQSALWPRSAHEIDQARKSLWGVGLAPHKTSSFDPFDHVYQLEVHVMERAYYVVDSAFLLRPEAVLHMFASAVKFLRACPLSLLAVALRKVQDGFAIWVADASRKTGCREEVGSTVQKTWQELLSILDSLPQKDSTLLKALEALFVAAFSSPHRAVVTATIQFWNCSFGLQNDLEYPPKLEKVLRARLVEADISLPGFPECQSNGTPAKLPAFFESQCQVAVASSRPHATTVEPSLASSRVPATALPLKSTPIAAVEAVASRRPSSSGNTDSGSSTPRPTPRARPRHDDSQVQFAPIESSPASQPDESQMLTDHQKEVRARQQANAHIFPDLSSSPVVKTTGSVQKRLNFTPRDNAPIDEDFAGTPLGLPEADGIMSDDLPSSPTPSSNKDLEPTRVTHDEDNAPDEEQGQDPPSSPPRSAERAEDSGLHDQYSEDDVDEPDAALNDEEQAEDLVDESVPTTIKADIDIRNAVEPLRYHNYSDLPSDTTLPTAQLQLEEEAATAAEAAIGNDTTEGTTFVGATPGRTIHATDAQQDAERQSSPEALGGDLDRLTRIEDSFIEDASLDDDDDLNPGTERQQRRRTGTKRKRSRSVVYTSKKRVKQQSPFKQWIQTATSALFGRSQEEDDEDIGEEIVVASSQRSSSPIDIGSPESARAPPSKLMPESPQPVAGDPPVESMPPPKRGRGRPRKSATPTPAPSQVPVGTARTLKRKASVLSITSAADEPTSSMKDTISPRMTRRSAQLSQEEASLGRSSRRTVAAVVVPAPDEEPEQDDDEDSEDLQDLPPATPDAQLEAEAAAAFNDRPIATPRSIIGRFKEALQDLKHIFIGPQEEREMDDVLFELRREVYEAARRGREQE